MEESRKVYFHEDFVYEHSVPKVLISMFKAKKSGYSTLMIFRHLMKSISKYRYLSQSNSLNVVVKCERASKRISSECIEALDFNSFIAVSRKNKHSFFWVVRRESNIQDNENIVKCISCQGKILIETCTLLAKMIPSSAICNFNVLSNRLVNVALNQNIQLYL